MTAETADGPPTLGQVAYEGFVAFQEPDGFEFETWADKDEHGDSAVMGRADWEAAGAAAGAAAIARLDTPAELADAMTENVRLRKELVMLRADLADAEAKLANANWPLCPNGCGCRLGTEDAEARDCACDGLCCYDEIEVSELFAERDRLRKELHERDAQLADALTPTAADFDHAAEIMRLRGVLERLAGELEAEIAHLRATGVTRGNRDRQELATRIREALRAMEFDPEAPAEPQLAPALTPVEAVRTAVAEEWQPRVDALRGLLDEIGVMAANAPEDGDSFGLLEQIAWRIAAVDVPDSTPLDEWPDPENPITGRTPGAAATVDITGEVLTAAVQGKRILLQLGGGNVPQPAPELTAAMAETRELRKVITELLGMFRAVSGGWGARTSSSRLRKIAERVAVPWDEYKREAPDTDEAAETRRVRELLGELLGEFSARQGDGFRARLGVVAMNRYCERGGVIPVGRTAITGAGTEHLAAQITEGRQA